MSCSIARSFIWSDPLVNPWPWHVCLIVSLRFANAIEPGSFLDTFLDVDGETI